MNQSEFFQLYFATVAVIAGLSGFIITHLLNEIRSLHERVNEIYNILLER